ncbi:hypothetical protein [Salipiger bermudensis]|uniref:hypothetical protein n=1 Tax=Salipiger bermudensis TaxID=344736 RepID=UPI00300BF952
MQIAPKSIFEAPLERPDPAPGIRLGRGWHAGGDNACWSRSKQAELAVCAEAFPDPVPLRLRLRLFNAAPDRPRRLRVLSPGHDPIELTVTTPAPVAVRLRSPRHAEDAALTPIRLELDTLDSPFLAGQSADERLLGLSITEIQTGVPELAFPLEISPAGNGGPVLAGGWGAPEEGGAWSVGPSAILHLPGELSTGGPAELLFEADVLPRPGDQPPLEVEIREQGATLARWQLRAGEAGPWRCPLPDWSNALDRRLELAIGEIRSPAALGINTDDRPLGLRLKRIALHG